MLDAILQWVQSLAPGWGYTVLALAAMIEYIFPPFPGDTITLLGAVLIDAVGWSLPAVLTAVTLGSVAGAWIDYEAGAALARGGQDNWLGRKLASEAVKPKVDLLCERFARHGAIYIGLNRFVPGIRAFFFVVAGMAGLPRGPVIFWSAASALAWNGLIIALGYAIGFNLPALSQWVSRYTTAAYAVMALVGVIMAVRWWKGRQSSKAKQGSPSD
mgnify:CR=1 FL=1